MDNNVYFDNNKKMINNTSNKDIINYAPEDDTEYYLMELVGKNKPYFLNTFNFIENNINKVNWCALFFALPYLFYRKMFKKYAITASIPIVLFVLVYICRWWIFSNIIMLNFITVFRSYSSVDFIIDLIKYISFLYIIPFNIYVGITFNKRYYMHLLSLLCDNTLSDKNLIMLKSITGVSVPRVVIYFIILMLPIILIVLALFSTISIFNFFN